MKQPTPPQPRLPPATQARLLLRWIAIAIAAALVAATYYFYFSLPGSA